MSVQCEGSALEVVELVVLLLPQVSQISSVFDCLLEEEERSLKENPVDSVQWAEVVLTVNNIIKVKTSFTVGHVGLEQEDEPTSTGGMCNDSCCVCRTCFRLPSSTEKPKPPCTDLLKMHLQSLSISLGQVMYIHLPQDLKHLLFS